MLGRYSRGMKVKIPAVFQDAGKNPVDVDNVICTIEHFSSEDNKIIQLLPETPMGKVKDGFYMYEYVIPPNSEHGNYIVRIKAKQPGSKSIVLEATDFFEIGDSMVLQPGNQPQSNPDQVYPPAPTTPYRQPAPVHGERVDAEDTVTDQYGQPLPGVHVNIFEKNTFQPQSTNNVKIGSAITDMTGKWTVSLLPGDYVFTYKHPDRRATHEFRKVQKS